MKTFKSPLKRSFFSKWWVLFPTISVILIVVHILVLSFFLSNFRFLDTFLSFIPKQTISGINIVAFGVDDTRDSKRSDTIIVFHIDEMKQHVGALSIPRDTRVNIQNVGFTRINHAYAHGGVSLLKNTLTDFLGLPINHFVKIDLSGVAHLIDEIGGIKLDIKKDMKYSDFAGNLHINLQKGTQTLTGQQVIQYLRFRKDNEGDIGRIRRQQYFLSQLAHQLISIKSLVKLPRVIAALRNVVNTDLTFSQMITLGTHLKKVLEQNNLRKGTVPGAISLVDGAYFWKPNPIGLDHMIDDVLLGFNVVSSSASSSSSSLLIDNTQTSEALSETPFSTSSSAVSSSELKTESLKPATSAKPFKVPNPLEFEELTFDSTSLAEELSFDVDPHDLSSAISLDYLADSLPEPKTQPISEKKKVPTVKPKDTIKKAENITPLVSKKEEKPVQKKKDSMPVEVKASSKPVVKITKPVVASVSITQPKPEKKVNNERRNLSVSEIQRIVTLVDITDRNLFSESKIEVLNGSGKNGLAKSSASLLKQYDLTISRFDNAGHSNYPKTKIVDWKGNIERVLALASFLQIAPENIIVYDRPSKPIDFTLVLGQDWQSLKANLEEKDSHGYSKTDS